MARKARIVISNLPHYVVQAGNRGTVVFFSDSDRALYLELLETYTRRYGVKILSYCIMDEEVHLILLPHSEVTLARALSITHMRYAHVINQRLGWSGHLWKGRFFSSVLDKDYLKIATHFIENLPVKHSKAEKATEYIWSSAREHAGLEVPKILQEFNFSDTKPLRKEHWANWLASPNDEVKEQNLKNRLRRDLPCGSQEFLNFIEESKGIKLKTDKKGRPRRMTQAKVSNYDS